ncbi:DUF6517 family protein [Halohasta salina]|uniref:DUF6517 family protein n=1 Tax=Halohasta salina TaxID=2961621 RepID=UPI0020A3D4AE|nr:DUF6517 family protein [Halohasta salina]
MYTRRRLLAAGTIGVAALGGCLEFATGEGPLRETAQPAAVEDAALSETGYEQTDERTETVSQEVDAAGQTRTVEAVNQVVIYERSISAAALLGNDTDGESSAGDADALPDDGELPDDLPEDYDGELPEDYDGELPDDIEDSDTQQTADDGGSGDDRQGGWSRFILLTTPAFSIAGQSLNPVGKMDNAELLSMLSGEFEGLSVGDMVSETTATVLETETTVSTFDGEIEQNGLTVDLLLEITVVPHEGDYVVAVAGYPQALEPIEADNVDRLVSGLVHPA